MYAAGLLLTGGGSRRLGHDKATLHAGSGSQGLTFAQRTADLLAAATHPVIEVGPGYTTLPSVSEQPPGEGPLVALAAGVAELRRLGWDGPAVVLATDMPRLDSVLVEWLAAHRQGFSVVPVVEGRLQPLCARYEPRDLATACSLSSRGVRSMHEFVTVIAPVPVGPEEWKAAGIDAIAFADIDGPEDLADYRTEKS